MAKEDREGITNRLTQRLQGREISVPLRSRVLRLALVCAVITPLALLSAAATRVARAARLGSHLQPGSLRQAIALDPTDAAYDHQLGLVYAYSFGEENPRESVRFLQTATELNPNKADYWADLAEACNTINNSACANRAIQRALNLGPATPRFEWMAGNYYLGRKRTDEALEHFRRLLVLDNTYAQSVFRVSLGTLGDPDLVYRKVLPASAEPHLRFAFLDFISAHEPPQYADNLWTEISNTGFRCEFSEIKTYLQRLLDTGEIEQATRVWSYLEKTKVIPKPDGSETANLAYNGGFEQNPLQAGFDWRAVDTEYVELDFHAPSAYQGARCLRVDYAAGHNQESEPVYELIPVGSHPAYRLQAYVRSDGITSASGPRLRVTDPECPSCLDASTPATTGTTPWHPVSLQFTASPKTRLIRLSIWRPRSRSFPMEISGTFWVDDVSVEPVNSPSKETARLR